MRDELFGGDDLLAFEEDLEIELDLILLEDELFEDILFEDELLEEVLLVDELLGDLLFEDFSERMLVILPRVVLVFLDLVFVDVFGIFLSSLFCLISGLVFLILLKVPDWVIFVDGV